MCKSLMSSQFPTPVTILWTKPRTQHLWTQVHKTIHFRSSWVTMPIQEDRSHFFPVYPFPRQLALEGRRRPPFMEYLLGARHWAEHFIHFVRPMWYWTPVPTKIHSSLLPEYMAKCYCPTNGRWVKVVYVTYKPGLQKPPTHCLPPSLPHLLPGTLDDLDRFGLKVVKPVLA